MQVLSGRPVQIWRYVVLSNADVARGTINQRALTDSCHNYHPPKDGSTASSSGKQQLPYHLSVDGIKADLTYGDDRPTWPLSAYGPGRDAPRQLLEGPLEQSPEELRTQYHVAKAGGSTQQYEQNERIALDEANQRIQQILNDVDGAIKYIIDGKDQHPNREDQVQKSAGSFSQSTPQASGGTHFGQPSSFGNGSSSAFGKPSTFGSGTAFGGGAPSSGSAFGGGQSGGASAFGQPSSLGGGSTAFGQPSGLGSGPSALGKPSALGGGSAFGSQSAPSSTPFGQSAASAAPPTFGQTSTTTAGSAFGQPQAPGGSSAFGQSSAPGSGTTFGKPSPFGTAASSGTPAFGSTTPFGAQPPTTSSAFGQPSQSGQQQSAFGQPSQSSGAQQSTFGQTSQSGQQQSAFGQPSQPGQQQSSFGKPSPFGASAGGTSAPSRPAFGSSTPFGASTGTSAFGQSSTSGQQQSPFASSGQAPAFGSSSAGGSAGAFGSQQPAAKPSPFASAAGTASRPAGQPMTSFNGQPVTYEDRLLFYRNPTTGKQERIWFPDGPPGPNPDVEASQDVYGTLTQALKQVYDFTQQNGVFKDGIMPEIPPKREWVNWEL